MCEQAEPANVQGYFPGGALFSGRSFGCLLLVLESRRGIMATVKRFEGGSAMRRTVLGLGLVLALPGVVLGADGALPTLEQGMKVAERSGQAILYITKWAPGA